MIATSAKEVIEAMKATPMLLAVLVINIVVLVGFAFTLHEVSNAMERRESFFKACLEK